MKTTRREIIGSSLGALGVALLPPALQAAGGAGVREPVAARALTRPHLLVTAGKVDGLRSVAELRTSAKSGHGRTLWEDLRTRADADVNARPLEGGSRNYTIVNATATRVLRHALAFVITEDERYRNAALAQIEATFDPQLWTDWRDAVAPAQWHTGLRMGQLGSAFGLAYDWLHASLSAEERRRVVAGVDRCGIQPYLKAVETGSWVVGSLNNFASVIPGGLAIAGMAFEDDHPQSARLVELGRERMVAYLGEFGPDGEWNESIPYAASFVNVVAFCSTLRYWSAARAGGNGQNSALPPALAQFCRWLMYMTRPHGREALFGNGPKAAGQRRISLSHLPAVAAAGRDGILQSHYLNNLFPDQETDGMRNYALELVWYDQTLAPVSPEGRDPHGKVFPANTGCVSSRTDWDARSTPCLVYGKGGSAYEINGHNDVGQVCIDGYGEPLILDPGGYHVDQKSSSKTFGLTIAHNVLIFDRENMRADRPIARAIFNAPERRKTPALRSKFLQSRFDDSKGGYWQLDTTDVYAGVNEVRRTVVHLNPGVVVVLDTAILPRLREISLRWHTADKSVPTTDGRFSVTGASGATLASRVVRLDQGAITFARETHQETSDSFVEASLRGTACSLLSVFCVFPRATVAGAWELAEGVLSIAGPGGLVDVRMTGTALSVAYRDGRMGWQVALPPVNL